jgi:hypothetical protein
MPQFAAARLYDRAPQDAAEASILRAMRSRILLAAAPLAAVAAAFAGSAQASLPRLQLADASPFSVAGAHFGKHERVHLRVGSLVRVVRAGLKGSFVATFPSVHFDPCGGGMMITAVGARGETATLKLNGRACPPAP